MRARLQLLADQENKAWEVMVDARADAIAQRVPRTDLVNHPKWVEPVSVGGRYAVQTRSGRPAVMIGHAPGTGFATYAVDLEELLVSACAAHTAAAAALKAEMGRTAAVMAAHTCEHETHVPHRARQAADADLGVSAILYHPNGPTSYRALRAKDLAMLGTVDRLAQDWRSRRSPSWSYRDDVHGIYGTAKNRRVAGGYLLEIYEREEKLGKR